jgi:GNAT superfamily N-acetyltransferase
MNDHLILTVIVCVEDQSTRTRCSQLLSELATAAAPVGARWDKLIFREISQDQLISELHRTFDSSPTGMILLLSDLLADVTEDSPKADCQLTYFAKDVLNDCKEHCRDCQLGTIAILERYRHVPDIDRALRRSFERSEFIETLTLAAEKLWYIHPPQTQKQPRPIVIRSFKSQAEMMKYYQFRHKYYRIMSYLDVRTEFAPSGMEINECDPNSLHIGAFEQKKAGEEVLVGTARVIGLEPLDVVSTRWTRELARGDAVLKTRLERPLALGLPIFQSMHRFMRDWEGGYKKLLTEQQCGELSRVIVAPGCRGIGLSGGLVHFALLKAYSKGIGRFFLECLPTHEEVYGKLGFQRIEGMVDRVFGVDRTMIAMEMKPDAVESVCRRDEFRCLLDIIRNQGQLCLCQYKGCFRDSNECGWEGTCPVR